MSIIMEVKIDDHEGKKKKCKVYLTFKNKVL